MVRVYPINRSLAPSGHFDGFQDTMKIQVAELHAPSNVIQSPKAIYTCHSIDDPHPYGIFYGENPLNFSFTLLLFEVALIIIIIQTLRFLLKPLKQPRIIAEIIGGLIIGPSVLGHNKKFFSCLYPENTQYVLRNIGLMGLMYFVFVIGVKMDLSLVKKARKKEMYIAFAGMVLPFIIVAGVALIMRKSMDKALGKISSIGAISSSTAITSFPCIYTVLEELNLLSSEVGRMSLSTSIICDAIGLVSFFAFEAAKQGETKPMAALWYLISLALLGFFIVYFVARGMNWIINQTPEGHPVDQGYVVAILLFVLVMGFVTDFLGIAIVSGPLMLGLVVPDGPPLGSTLVTRCETLIYEILMPITFIFIGLTTDVYSMSAVGWLRLSPLFALALTGYFSKLLVTLMAAVFVDVPLRESLTLSLILSLRGQVKILLYLHWMDKGIIGQPGFTLLMLLTTAVTGTCTALISILYDPTKAKPYMVNKRRTIQHTSPENEIRIVLCMHDLESVDGLIKLIEFSNPTVTSPLSIFALHLIELVGRAAPLFIDHEEQELPSKYGSSETILGALKLYQESQNAFLKLRTFTAVAPKKSMYQDICKLALECKATLVILPFHKELLDNIGGTEVVLAGVRSVNSNVLAHAPCSVGILVDKGNLQRAVPAISTENSAHHFVMLFLGGADAREALVFADRMAGNRNISVTVIRFLSYNFNGDNEMEKKLDDGLVTWFWVKNEKNNWVVYREVVVRDGDETIAAIQTMNDQSYDLWIVGRKQGINLVLLEGLTNWSHDDQELGVIGDYLTSVDFGSSASVLVMQQQIMRSNVGISPCSLGIFPCASASC